MGKYVFIAATVVGVLFSWIFGEKLEMWQILAIAYAATVIGMFLLRYTGIEFKKINSTTDIFLWAVPVSFVYVLWIGLVSVVLLLGLLVMALVSSLKDVSLDTPTQQYANNNDYRDEMQARLEFEYYREEHNKRKDEEIRRANAQGYYRKAASYEREKI